MRLLRFVPIPLLIASGACRDRPAAEMAPTPTGETFRAAVEAVLPAVVHIQVEAASGWWSEFVPGDLEPPPSPDGFEPVPPPSLPRQGAGSGVIISSDGYILTADHVVQQADRVTVTLHDRRQFEAHVIARDPSTDVAVVRIDGNDLPVARLYEGGRLRLGDWVVAVGSPLGLEFTVTAGVISATGRAIGILGAPDGRRLAPLEHFIQTDAAINPGNSGGPLVNLQGEVVGLSTAIASPTGFFAGYGFAVPIDLARRVARDLIEYGFARRSYLGLLLENVDQVDAKVYGLDAAEGAHVVHVQENGPAAAAGIQLGDVVVGIAGTEVSTVSDLQAALAQLEPGTTVPLEIRRYGRALQVPVELGLMRTGVKPAPPPPPDDGPIRLGFLVVERPGGVTVAAVQPYSRAARAGVRPGQIVHEINRHPVASAAELGQRVAQADEGVVSLIVTDPEIGRRIINFELRP